MKPFEITLNPASPLIGAAIHDGHHIRAGLTDLIELDDAQRLREEDPFTGRWARLAPSFIVERLSRFEIDLNRPRHLAVYRTPDEAWGLHVWKSPPADSLISESLAIYDDFYSQVHDMLSRLLRTHRHVLVLDIHSYNHRRDSKSAPPADCDSNPEVNVGTGTMDRKFWTPVIESLISDLGAHDFAGRHLDVRENVKFQGGYFGKWIHENFPNQVCVPAIEFKKFFMDEWTGEPYDEQLRLIDQAIQATFSGILVSLKRYADL